MAFLLCVSNIRMTRWHTNTGHFILFILFWSFRLNKVNEFFVELYIFHLANVYVYMYLCNVYIWDFIFNFSIYNFLNLSNCCKGLHKCLSILMKFEDLKKGFVCYIYKFWISGSFTYMNSFLIEWNTIIRCFATRGPSLALNTRCGSRAVRVHPDG